MSLPKGYEVVFALDDKIYAWSRKFGVQSAQVPCNNSSNGHITSFAIQGVSVYHAGYDQVVRETKTGQRISRRQRGEVFGLTNHENHLIALEYDLEEEIEHAVIRLYDVRSDETIAEIRANDLDFRPGSLELASLQDSLFLASRNVVKLQVTFGRPQQTRLTEELADVVHLATNDKKVYVVHMVRGSGNRIAWLEPNYFDIINHGWAGEDEHGKSTPGYITHVAIKNDTLVIGVSNGVDFRIYTRELHPDGRFDLEMEMPHKSVVNESGNPMIVVPPKILQQMLS